MNITNILTYWDRVMMAITFAEANEAETARKIMTEGDRNQKRMEKVLESRPSLEL